MERRITTAHRRTRRAGITLIEVSVAVLIVGILLAIAVPAYNSTQSNANQKGCQENLAAIYQAEDAYRTRNRAYTTNLSADLGPSLGGLPKCPSGTAAYTATVTGTGASQTVTITCNNTGAHVAGKKLTTSDGLNFVAQ